MWYIIQVSAYTALMYVIYLLVLKNRVQYQWSRFFLIGSTVIPLALPFCRLPFLSAYIPADRTASQVLLPVINIGDTVGQYTAAVNEHSIFIAIYITVSLFLLTRFAVQYISMHRFIKKNTAEQKDGVYVFHNTSIGPGSWGRYIFLPGADEDRTIYAHELAHIRLKHSYDIVLMRLLGCLAWPDVMLWLIIKELKMVHEFQADAIAMQGQADYTATLLNIVLGTRQFSLSHTFFHHPLKRRVYMLHKKTSSGKVRTTSLLLGLMMVTAIIWMQSCSKNSDGKQTYIQPVTRPETGIVTYPEKMPEPSVNIADFFAENLVYPAYARQHNIQGRVVVKFVVDANGNIKDPKVMKSPDTSLSRVALEVFKKMPKWMPGQNKGRNVAVAYVLPVSFKMNNTPKR